MDLTPDALRETTFRGALRGYNVDDVDEFVEKVAVGMTELLEQLRQASERAAAADRRAKEVATSEDAMRRTLGHAQKLAEAVLAEARQEAARVTDEAHQSAAQLRAEAKDLVTAEHEAAEAARSEGERIRTEAQAERGRVQAEVDAARRAAAAAIEADREAARGDVDAMAASAAERIDADLQAEIQRLHGVRQALQLDVAVLTSWMHDQRDSVRNVLVETLAAIDRAAPADDPPPVSEVDTTVRLAGHPVGLVPAVHDPPPPPPPEAPAEGASPPVAVRRAEPQPVARYEPAPPAPPATFPDLSDEEFLAELKKAAAGGDDSLFGPGDQGRPS